MKLLLLPLFTFLLQFADAQCKTFTLASNGDTLNCTDTKGLKQGKWLIKVPKLRGEPGYEEEGVYKNDRKDGVWRTFSLLGDLQSQENYKWGNKNGRCLYFTIAGLEHEESWRAVNPDKAYDTLDVQDLKDPNKYEQIVVKTDGTSLKHGTWKYYMPETATLVEMQEYIMGKLKDPENPMGEIIVKSVSDSTKTPVTKPASMAKPKEVLEFEKKNAKKKKVKVVDGRTSPTRQKF